MLVTGSSSILEGHVAYSNYNITQTDSSKHEKYSSISGYNMGLDITNFIGTNRMRYGISFEGYTTDYKYYNPYGIDAKQYENTINISAYATYKLTSGKWAKIGKCSSDTALNDINDLVSKGILKKNDEGGRSTNYSLIIE